MSLYLLPPGAGEQEGKRIIVLCLDIRLVIIKSINIIDPAAEVKPGLE
jgi:hypothetical protein